MSEWELRVSQREIDRMHVVGLTIEGRETVGRGAKLLGISVRQMKRLRRKMKEQGVEGLLHGNRGKASWNKTVSEKINQVLQLARGRYHGLNDTHLTEKLKENEKIALSRPTVRTILRQDGIAAVRSAGSSVITRGANEKLRREISYCGMGARIVGLGIKQGSGV